MDLKSLISKIEQLSEAADYEASISKREKSADFSTKPHEKRGKKVSGKRYGAQDDDDRDDDDEEKKSEKKSEEPKVKRGRGRPKKHSDAETGEVPKYSFGKELQGFMIGNLPGGKLPGKPGKKHKLSDEEPKKSKSKLKDWMEHVEGNMLAEDSDMNVNIVTSKPTQPTSTLTVNNKPVITSTSNNPRAQQTLKSLQDAMQSGEFQFNPDALREEELEEVAAPGQEEWIKDNKKSFIDQYGKKKGMSVLFSKAWERSKSMKESVEHVMEGYTLEDVLESFPHEHKQCQEGWGMDEGLYEALCEYYFKQGRIPRKVWHGPLDELRQHVEECYMEDTGADREVLEGFETASPGDSHMSPLANEDEQLDEMLPALAGVGGALARGAAFGAGKALADRFIGDDDESIDEDEGFMGPDLMDEDDSRLEHDLDVLDDGGLVDSNPRLQDKLYQDDEMVSEQQDENLDRVISKRLDSVMRNQDIDMPAYKRTKPLSLDTMRDAGQMAPAPEPMSHADRAHLDIQIPAVSRGRPLSGKDLDIAAGRTMSGSENLSRRATELGLDEGRKKKEEPLNEKWGTKMHTAEKDVGKWKGWTIERLKARKEKLMKKEERTAAEQKEVKQLNFAIRAKQKDGKWGKIKEAHHITGKIANKKPGMTEGLTSLSIQQLATISDEALDKAYGYGRSSPGNTFGWQANLMSAAYAKKMIDAGVTDIEKIADAIHKGWNITAQKFVQNPDQFSDTEKLRAAGKLEAKLQQRAQLMKQNYAQLPEEEKEKDRVVARALLHAITGQQDVAEDSKTNKHKESKMRDAQMESWDRQLKTLLKEGLTITTSTGQAGGSDSVSVNATDADAQKLMKMLHNAGIYGSVGASMGMDDAEGTPGIAIDVEPMAQDEVLGQLHGADDDGDDALGFLKRMIGARGGDMEMQHGDYEQEQGHDHDHEHEDIEVCDQCECDPCECDDEHEHEQDDKVVMVGEEEADGKSSRPSHDELARREELGPYPLIKYRLGYKATRKGKTPHDRIMRDLQTIAGPKSKLPEEEEVEEGNEFTKARLDAIKHGKSSFKVGDKTYKVKGDTSDEKKQVGEEKETCNECGAIMEADHECNETANDDPATMESRKHKHGEQLDEWANSPAGKSEDEEFTTELDYMTKLIAGGLNGPKRDQTTLPHTQVKTELGGNADVSAMMRKLAGIR